MADNPEPGTPQPVMTPPPAAPAQEAQPGAPAVPQTEAQLREQYQKIQSSPELQGALAALKEL